MILKTSLLIWAKYFDLLPLTAKGIHSFFSSIYHLDLHQEPPTKPPVDLHLIFERSSLMNWVLGGFHVAAKIIREVKSHMIPYKFKCSHWW